METEEHIEGTEDFMSCVDVRPDFPTSYTENSLEEEHLVTIAHRFQRAFSLLYPNRRPLLLCAANDCGLKLLVQYRSKPVDGAVSAAVGTIGTRAAAASEANKLWTHKRLLFVCPQKLVSTTLRPTMPGLAELHTWEQCARFVSASLTLQPLDRPSDLPRTLRSPQAVLQSQSGSSLEYANLLCSLLLGLNYNAYCVSGYAAQHLCELDRSQESCPLQEQTGKSPLLEPQEEGNKYNRSQERKLHSNFVLKQEKKLSAQQDSQPHESGCAPTPGVLCGLRVHFWVLVLAGSASVEQDFFIEPLTGNCYPPGHPHFLGVESLWNELNVYINMQDCAKGCQDMVWNPEDLSHWEPLVYGTASRKQLQAMALRRMDNRKMGIQSDKNEESALPYTYDMPLSWCSRIRITAQDLEMCWPGGFKVTHFKQALLENFIPCFSPDGVVTRLTLYTDQHKSEVKQVKEWFQNRGDLLMERDSSGGFTTELFSPGHSAQLIFHRFNTIAPVACPAPEAGPALPPSVPSGTPEREMRFGPFRVDGLVSRVEGGNLMMESFEKRRDFLFQRETLFGEQLDSASKPLSPLSPYRDTEDELNRRPILKVVEKFHRDPSKAAHEDIAERAFLLAERRIEVTYHLEGNHVIAAKRSFDKPSESTSSKRAGDFTADMVSTFQVEPTAQPLTLLHLNQLLLKLMKEEQKSISQIRSSQRSVQSLVLSRAEEQEKLTLKPRHWTTNGTGHAREHRQRVMLLGEEMRWLELQQKDLLAPVLMRLNGTTDLSPDQAQTVYESCLQDFRSRMIHQARLIQQRIQEDTRALEQRQLDFQKDLWTDSHHQEYCAEMTRQIHVAQKRLQIHKECAPHKYKGLEQQLRADLRIGPHLQST